LAERWILIAAGSVYGISLGALFGIVFAYGRKSLPGNDNGKKALFLKAGILWFIAILDGCYQISCGPPAVGDPETIYYRQSLYVGYCISGFHHLH